MNWVNLGDIFGDGARDTMKVDHCRWQLLLLGVLEFGIIFGWWRLETEVRAKGATEGEKERKRTMAVSMMMSMMT